MSVICLECQTENRDTARTCAQCQASLRPAYAALYLDRAEAEISKGQHEVASQHIAKADAEMLPLSASEREQRLLSARAFWLQSSIYYYKKMMAEAEQEALAAARLLEHQPHGIALLALVYNRLGSIAHYQNRAEEAMERYQRSSDLATAAGDFSTAAKAAGNLGIVLSGKGDEAAASVMYQQALSLAEASNDSSVMSQMCRLLTNFYSLHGPFSAALSYAQRATELAHQVDNLYVRISSLEAAATVYIRYGDIAKGIELLREAYEGTRYTDNRITGEVVILGIAELMRNDAFSKYNELWMEQAVAEFSGTLNDSVAKGTYALQMSYYHLHHQDLAKMQRFCQQLGQANMTNFAAANIVKIIAARALLHAGLGDWETAIPLFDQAINSEYLEPYHRASLSEDYVKMLLNSHSHNPPEMHETTSRLELAARIYHELELPHLATKVEAMIGTPESVALFSHFPKLSKLIIEDLLR